MGTCKIENGEEFQLSLRTVQMRFHVQSPENLSVVNANHVEQKCIIVTVQVHAKCSLIAGLDQ